MSTQVSSEQWLLTAITYFRELSFFEKQASLSDTELAAMLRQLHDAEEGEDFDPIDSYSDLLLLRWDEQRVWWDEVEADVCAENSVYERVIQEWGNISRGSFFPENVKETWHAEEGPVEITFVHRGEPVEIRPNYLDDYIDIDILGAINGLIQDTGIQFEVYRIFDQSAFVKKQELKE